MGRVKQEFTSENTSVNTVSSVYTQIFAKNPDLFGVDILDYGGGKYNTNIEYMKKNCNSRVFVYDPYNRSAHENEMTIRHFINDPAKYVVCSNVLNVIKEDEVIIEALNEIYTLMDVGGRLYISIYERNKTGIGCQTTKGWQRNQRAEGYYVLIYKGFKNNCLVRKYKGFIEVLKLA